MGSDVQALETLAHQNTPTRVVGRTLGRTLGRTFGRTPEAVAAKAGADGISLKPANQPPYDRRTP